ncbi:hypothetical protein KFE98_20670 [bacterium SCSIO 12741]|nr:hypothetical protein KFE98_20670 [bacterium SCSIO 12741]
MKNQLDQIRENHLDQLREKLSQMKSPIQGSGIMAALSFGSQAQTLDKDLKQLLAEANSAFVDELNKKEVEDAFSVRERMQCYETYRADCSTLVSEYTSGMLGAVIKKK